MTEEEWLEWAILYARSYWRFGMEPESQAALKVLADAVTTDN
jgi:hypothetical protein